MIAIAAMAALFVGACGGQAAERPAQPPSDTRTTSTTTAPTRYFTVQELAAAVGCEARIQGKATDFREASCLLNGSKIVFVDFDTAQGQRAWLDYAQMYGGIFLVGDRWAMSGTSRDFLERLRPTLGGTIEGAG